MNPSGSARQDNLSQAINNAMALLHQGQFNLAREQADEILAIVPNEVNSLFVHAVVMRAQGDNLGALVKLETLLQRREDFAIAQQELGYTLAALGRFLDAIVALQKAVAIEPKLPGAWRMMGELFLVDEDETSAAEAFRQHLLASSSNPVLVRAAMLFSQGHIAQAESLCRETLKQDPCDVNAIRLLAEIGVKVGVFDDAENLLERCLELKPQYYLARLDYANLLSKREKLEQALAQLDTLLAIEANKPSLLVLRASILAKMGDFEPALECYQYLIEHCPPRSKIALSYGHALKAIGRQKDAIAAYRSAIDIEPSFGDAYWSLANLKTFRFTEQDIAAMILAADNPACTKEDAFHLNFALGKAYEHQKQFDRSFYFYQKGNASKKIIEAYSADENHRLVQRMKSICTPRLFDNNKGCGAPEADPIFIVGLPRSGSTLLEQILASHSQVDGTKELVHILAIVQRLGERRRVSDVAKYPEVLADLDAEKLQALGKEYLERTRVQRAHAPFFIDKMPNNYLHVGLISLILPNAKIIDARRHPMAACFSGFSQLFAKGQAFTYDLEDIGRYYCDYVDMMDHWAAVLPGKVLRVNYEQMVTNTEAMVKNILDFCGLPFEQQCLSFYQTDRAIRTASSEQVRQPIYRSGLDHWQNYTPYLDTLKKILGPIADHYPSW